MPLRAEGLCFHVRPSQLFTVFFGRGSGDRVSLVDLMAYEDVGGDPHTSISVTVGGSENS